MLSNWTLIVLVLPFHKFYPVPRPATLRFNMNKKGALVSMNIRVALIKIYMYLILLMFPSSKGK
jgi:hypothetical protein